MLIDKSLSQQSRKEKKKYHKYGALIIYTLKKKEVRTV